MEPQVNPVSPMKLEYLPHLRLSENAVLNYKASKLLSAEMFTVLFKLLLKYWM